MTTENEPPKVKQPPVLFNKTQDLNPILFEEARSIGLKVERMAPAINTLMDRAFIERTFADVAAKNLDAVMAVFADDALLYDPHYPQPEMRGKANIRRGLEWGMSSMQKFGFPIRNCWIDGDKAVIEVDTHHVLQGGMELKFPQIFVIETRDGLITRLQSYVPYLPHGIPGLVGALTRWQWKLTGKL